MERLGMTFTKIPSNYPLFVNALIKYLPGFHKDEKLLAWLLTKAPRAEFHNFYYFCVDCNGPLDLSPGYSSSSPLTPPYIPI